MSISAVQSPPAYTSPMAPLSRMAGTFSYFLHSIPTLLVSFLALQSTGFASALEKPPVRDRYSSINPFKSEDTTAIWTNEIGQHTLNPEDAQGSSQSYAEAFQEPLMEWIEGMNSLASKSSSIFEGGFEHSLKVSKDRYVPQELQLDGAFKIPNKLFDYSDQVNSLDHAALANKALKILRSWSPNDEISIHTLKLIDASLGDNNSNLTLHLDGPYHAGLTIAASEYPLVKSEIWITKKGEKARLESIDETTGEIAVTLLENFDSASGKSAVLKDSDLDYHACVSGKTTQIVPGLIFNQYFLLQQSSPMKKHAYELFKYAVQLPYISSLLFLGDQLVHSTPSHQSEPNSLALKNCRQIYRKRLAVFYVRNSKSSSYSAFPDWLYRALIFFSKHAGALINAACILVSLFAVRVLTMPVP